MRGVITSGQTDTMPIVYLRKVIIRPKSCVTTLLLFLCSLYTLLPLPISYPPIYLIMLGLCDVVYACSIHVIYGSIHIANLHDSQQLTHFLY